MTRRCGRRNNDSVRVKKVTKFLKRLAFHSVIAMPVSVVCVIVGDILIGILMRAIGVGPIRALDAWYGPFVWWPGLVLGFFVNRRTLQRAACFVWLPGLVWLVYGILSTAAGWHPDGMSWMTRVRTELFPLTHDQCGMTECLGVLFYTWPALNSVAYSISAALALLFNGNKSESKEPATDYTTLGLG
jgi:hypothetical protein